MAWNSRTNLRAVEKTTQLVVAICHQMENWRRILRHLDRLEQERATAQSSPAHPSPNIQRQIRSAQIRSVQ